MDPVSFLIGLFFGYAGIVASSKDDSSPANPNAPYLSDLRITWIKSLAHVYIGMIIAGVTITAAILQLCDSVRYSQVVSGLLLASSLGSIAYPFWLIFASEKVWKRPQTRQM